MLCLRAVIGQTTSRMSQKGRGGGERGGGERGGGRGTDEAKRCSFTKLSSLSRDVDVSVDLSREHWSRTRPSKVLK